MAKKPPREPLGCTIATIVILGLAYSLPYIFSFSFYAFPIFLGFLLMLSGWRGPPASELIDEAQIAAAMRDLENAKRSLLDEIAGLKNAGAREGVRYLKAEDRFEMRSRRGQELNQALTNARSSLAAVVAQVEMTQHPEHRGDHARRLAMRSWRRGRAYRLAFIAAFVGFVASSTVLVTYVYYGAGSDLLVWNPFPQLIGRHVELGSIFGWVLGLTTLAVAKRRHRIIDERESDVADLDVDDPDDSFGSEAGDQNRIENQNQEVDDPYAILNVSRQATISEIKAAYRLAIVKCHPDTVADRSKSIREVAEAEAQRVNAAYDAIRNEHGFS
ncbi:J domain-containing protein [Bradyrhizobium sp. BRP56]|uniref:J domain-containing protein n=1 Tax=Bradyrhizobium sp. BRP56 TaxID=2793819 RepID=UPI001CD51B7A|nr:J domain-containing protein [Bradyrhizobium sp. BRP56]MCA1402549.1 J domain-containing protein [Bradyrhizobium sp. BRP56]